MAERLATISVQEITSDDATKAFTATATTVTPAPDVPGNACDIYIYNQAIDFLVNPPVYSFNYYGSIEYKYTGPGGQLVTARANFIGTDSKSLTSGLEEYTGEPDFTGVMVTDNPATIVVDTVAQTVSIDATTLGDIDNLLKPVIINVPAVYS